MEIIPVEDKPKRVVRPIDERIAELQQKQEQLLAREKALKKRAGKEERKLRTKRLIELGAVVEKSLGERVNDEEIDLPVLTRQIEIGAVVEKVFGKPIEAKKIPDFEKWLTEKKSQTLPE